MIFNLFDRKIVKSLRCQTPHDRMLYYGVCVGGKLYAIGNYKVIGHAPKIYMNWVRLDPNPGFNAYMLAELKDG